MSETLMSAGPLGYVLVALGLFTLILVGVQVVGPRRFDLTRALLVSAALVIATASYAAASGFAEVREALGAMPADQATAMLLVGSSSCLAPLRIGFGLMVPISLLVGLALTLRGRFAREAGGRS